MAKCAPSLSKHIEDTNIGMIDRQIRAFSELDAVQFVHREEDAVLQDIVEFKVGLHGGFINFEAMPCVLSRCSIPSPMVRVHDLHRFP